ncbi:MAG TPA: NAD-dependent epimerase/dehydratase family protein [Stellaceae bacterium]|nr:NAD-dependent epimerase/dehydratase family protein [Stellaceae bacterium]
MSGPTQPFCVGADQKANTLVENPSIAKSFQGAKVIITGGLGFIGSTLARRLVALGADVLLVDSLIPEYGGNPFNIDGLAAEGPGRVAVNISDIRDIHGLSHLIRGREYLFNLAGQTSHLDSMNDPIADLEINCSAQLALLEACRRINPDITVVYASTRQIYGRPDSLPVDERHLLRPVDVNGVNKMAGEAYHILYHQVYGMRTSALRLTNTYGPRMRIKDARQTFVGVWLRLVLEGKPFDVWGGEQLRDFTFADDAVEAFLAAATTDAAAGRAFNIGGLAPINLADLARTLVEAHGGGDFRIMEFPAERKRIDIGDYYADDGLFRSITGWQPTVPIHEGLSRSLAFYREHLAHYL